MRAVLAPASWLAAGEGFGSRLSNAWKAVVALLDRLDDGWAEAERAERDRKSAVKPSAGERRVGVTNRKEIGRAAVVMMCRIE